MVRIHGGFDSVHHLPSRSRRTEDIILFPKIIRRFNQESMAVTLADQLT